MEQFELQYIGEYGAHTRGDPNWAKKFKFGAVADIYMIKN